MLLRYVSPLLLLFVIASIAHAQEDPVEEAEEDVVIDPVAPLDTRPRGERADDGDLPPPPQRRRPRPGSSSSFGSFLSGFLGSVTKTASADGCPGKCIHALASLMCDSVLEDIQCPARNMRCCVEKSSSGKPKPPPREDKNPLDSFLDLELPPKPEEKVDENVEEDEEEEEEEVEVEVVEKKKKKRKRKKNTTTEATTTTTTTESTTTKAREKEEQKKSSNSSISRFYSSNAALSLVFVSLLTFLQTFKTV